MKTVGRTLLYLLAALTLLTACNEEKTYRIGVSQCGSGQWREKVNNEMLAAQHLYEQTAEVSIACAYDDTERHSLTMVNVTNCTNVNVRFGAHKILFSHSFFKFIVL